MLEFSDFFEDTTDYEAISTWSSRLTVVVPYCSNRELMYRDPEGYFTPRGLDRLCRRLEDSVAVAA